MVEHSSVLDISGVPEEQQSALRALVRAMIPAGIVLPRRGPEDA